MDTQDIRALKILEEIEKNENPSQRELARKLNVSLGLVNSFLKRLSQKGYFKITTIPRNRVNYILTPKGFAEKTRLTYEFIQYSLYFYRRARTDLKSLFRTLEMDKTYSVVFYGAGELAEIAYLTLQEFNLRLVGVVDDYKAGQRFFKHIILPPLRVKDLDFDTVIVTSIKSKDIIYGKALTLNVPPHQIVCLDS
nr:winged helix-turn-helix transcriptional regulator [Desulfobacterales bacterium]